MAGRELGRTPCPECGEPNAVVRQNEGKHPYRYCGECGANYSTRNSRQAADLMAKTRAPKLPPVEAAPEIEPATAGEPAPAPAPAPAAPARRAGLWEQLAGRP